MARGIPRQQLDMLQRVPLFSACSQKELREIAKLGTQIDFPAGRVLMKEGDPGSEAFLLLSGSGKCTINGRKVATYGPGDFFGEMALLDHGPRTATITAEAPATLLVFSAQEFGGLLSEAPSIARKMLQVVAGRLRAAEKPGTH